MAWTYSGNPASSSLDAVRFEIGDTDQSDQLLQNEEIEYCLDQESNFFGAAARSCEVIARKFARLADSAMGKTKIQASQKSQAYAKMAVALRRRATGYHEPFAGALDAEPVFTKGMMDNIS